LISFAIELDIPLKQMANFFDEQNTMDYKSFVAYGADIAKKKIKALEKGLQFIEKADAMMNLVEQYKVGQTYTRFFPEKRLYMMPYDKTFNNTNRQDMLKTFYEVPIKVSDVDYNTAFLEHGLFYEHSKTENHRYIFVEMVQGLPEDKCKVIPAGEYICKQDNVMQIEQADEIFKDYIDNKPFIAIEVEVFTGKTNINKPITELRVIPMP
jgi:hypothetical protein